MKQEIGLRTLIALKTKQSCLNHVISRWLEKTFKQRHLCKTAHIATILVIATTELASLIHCIPTVAPLSYYQSPFKMMRVIHLYI